MKEEKNRYINCSKRHIQTKTVFKKLLVSMIMILLFSLPLIAADSEETNLLEKMELKAENNYLSLYIDPSTTEIALLDRISGDTWFSNPPNLDKTEKIARSATKERMKSQIIIGYYRSNESTSQTDPSTVSNLALMDSYQDSVSYGQYKIEKIKDGIKVIYDFGQKWDYDDYIPKVIDEKSFNELLSKIDSPMDKKRLQKFYQGYSFVEDGAKDRVDISQLDEEKLFSDYSIELHDEKYQEKLEEYQDLQQKLADFKGSKEDRKDLEDQLSIARTKMNDAKITKIWGMVHAITDNRIDQPAANDLTREDFSVFYGKTVYVYQNAPVFMAKKFAEVIKNAGFTPEDITEIHKRNSIDPPIANIDVFQIPVEYTLDGDNLVVDIPADEIKYPKDALYLRMATGNLEYAVKPQRVTRPLNYINVLPYFGAADTNEEGYMFVPDGSGALINLNNGKTDINQYMAHVYGRDYAVAPQQSKKYSKENIHLPVYGMKKGSQAYLGIIEDGAAIARINADISGKNSSYNTISAEFVTMPVTNVGFGSSVAHSDQGVGVERTSAVEDDKTKVTVFQDRIYQGDIRVRYAFLAGKKADYVGMASYYREYLIRKYNLKKLNRKEKIPFYLELIGTIPVRKPIMGINMEVFEPLTTFEQAEEILDSLEGNGVGNIRLKYSGIINGGLDQGYPGSFKVARKLGGNSKLKKLADKLSQKDYQLYPEISFLNIYRDGLFDGFSPDNDSSRYFNRYPAKVFKYNPATFEMIPDEYSYLLSPRKISGLIDKFMDSYQKSSLDGLAFAKIGNEVYSDFRNEDEGLVDREQARDIMAEQLKKISDQGDNMMVNGGDDYTLPYASDIVNIPMNSSKYNLTDRDVPFMEIALHGIINYAGVPINLAEDKKRAVLKTIETGAYPYYKWFYRESSVVKNTNYNNLYTCDYRNWIEDAQNFYKEADDILNSLQDKFITGHVELESNVYKTTYDDGTSVIVNYNQTPVMIDGATIDGYDYMLQRR